MKKILVWIVSLVLALSSAPVYAETAESMFDQAAQLEWFFSSGAGAWSTDMRILPDGSFTGDYHDSDMGDAAEAYPYGTVYVCSFSGQMSLGNQVDGHCWEVRIDSLTMESEPGQESIEDGIRFVTANAYGISEGDTMQMYLPGAPTGGFTDEMRMWAHLFELEAVPPELDFWFLYSEKNESGFVGYPAEESIGMANPWVDLTAKELEQVCGVPFSVPDGAENVVCRWLENDQLAEIQFTMDGDDFNARVQQAGEVMNISGIYYQWENEESVQIGHCEGTLSQAKADSSDWVELCLWYDAAPGLMYSVSVCTTDPDGLDLTAVAESIFPAAQGDV